MTHPYPDGPLSGRRCLVTGVSRRQGIAYAVVRRLLSLGADVFATHHHAADTEQPWGGEDVAALLDGLRSEFPARRLVDVGADLAFDEAPAAVVKQARDRLGALDVLVCVHARSGGDGDLLECDAEMLDTHWAVNARSTLLLTRYFAEQFPGAAPPAEPEGRTGRVVWFTSGQAQGPMRGEIAYAASKAALSGIAPTVADELIERGIVLNVVNPGPVDTGYLSPEGGLFTEQHLAPLRARMPLGRFGHPDDPARLVAWLVSDEARWVVGQVIASEGGFRRYVL